MTDMQKIEVTHGEKRAVFTKTADGWTPDWFYLGDRPMLRFKDHEWLSIGHVHPSTAQTGRMLDDGSAVFEGMNRYGETEVRWLITVRPDPRSDGIIVDCVITPAADIELLEAYTTFETPYEYDGGETVTTVIGMNPVYKWKGPQRLTPPIWENPAWAYSRPQAARITGPCNAPYLCQTITDATDTPDRYITVVGDWTTCKVHDVYATPTRNVAQDPDSNFRQAAEKKGYKYIVGALNWSSAFAKDPNVIFSGADTHVQRVVVDFADEMPGGTLDRMLLGAWERAAAFDMPEAGRLEAYDRTVGRGVTWGSAVKWLRDIFAGDEEVEDLYKPGEGICTYATGSRPKAGGGYSWHWWPQWAGPLHYRARMTGDDELEQALLKQDELFAEASAKMDNFGRPGIANKVSSVPTTWWVAGAGAETVLHEAMRPIIEAACRHSIGENGMQPRTFDYGAQASLAETLLLGHQAYGDEQMLEQAMVLLGEMEDALDRAFWAFNVGRSDSLTHGGQIRSLGHGHAIMANLLAHRRTGEGRFLDQARRFARYLLAVSYASHNGSQDPDFDWRGWCNGSNAGRDQIAEFPPWETQNGLLCIASLMAETDLEPGFYDVLWYIARTGLAQFPAARTLKRILDPSMVPHFIPRDKIASERDFYDRWAYLAYENPHDQTLLASYQGSDCILGEFVYGGGMAEAGDDRLGLVVPRAGMMDTSEQDERLVHVWNPTAETIQTTVAAKWADGKQEKDIELAPRQVAKLTIPR